MRCWRFRLTCLLVFGAASSLLRIHAPARTTHINGTVVDPAEHVLPGVTITLDAVEGGGSPDGTPITRFVTSTVSDEAGQFEFAGLSAGTYEVTAERSGYARGEHPPALVLEGESIDVRLPLALAPLSEVVNVAGSTGAGEPLEEDEVRDAFLRVFQLPTDRFQEALPLLPGVIRGFQGAPQF